MHANNTKFESLTIIPRARMGWVNSPWGRMGYLLRGHEGERDNCFRKIQLAGKNIEKKKFS